MPAPALKPREKLPRGLNVDQFRDWYEQQTGRYELHNGDVFAMSPQRNWHATTKASVYRSLYQAVKRAGLPCHVMPEGAAVHVSDATWYEPEALVYCGPEAPGGDIKIDNPIVVVEIVSPSIGRLDETAKLAGYVDRESVQHYLIVSPPEKRLVHHKPQSDGTILTRIITSGPLLLDPTGLTVDLTELLS